MKQQIMQAPHAPGVYFFSSVSGETLYIGKAKNLRKRLLSYTRKHLDQKTTLMISHARQVEWIVTGTEVEALVLENRLINEKKPQYNIMLRESRRYAWIVVTKEEFPRIFTARTKRWKGTYFGPYTDGYSRRKVVLALNTVFKLRTCSTLPKRVCLQYHIKNCSGPCEGFDTQESYNYRVADAVQVLRGQTNELVKKYAELMKAASAKQRFEDAKLYRDTVNALHNLERMQVVERETAFEQDVIGFAREEEKIVAAVLHIRRGIIAKKNEYELEYQEGFEEEFVTALYRSRTPPKEIFTHGLENEQVRSLSQYFSQIVGGKVLISIPQRGEKKKLVELAQKNAQLALSQENPALIELQKKLKLAAPPATIDCFDVSTHQGSETVAACIRYTNGRPDPRMYRLFNMKTVVGQDDFASMQEAVMRRYREGGYPDLIVIDGGKGQLSAVLEVIGKKHQPVIALAKREEEIFVPGLSIPIRLDDKNSGLLLLRRIRDATHRFVINHHRKRRGKHMTQSELDHISGIGLKRKEALYARFKTFSVMKNASKKQLQEVLGEKTGERLFREFQRE